jgi:cell division protein FtsB
MKLSVTINSKSVGNIEELRELRDRLTDLITQAWSLGDQYGDYLRRGRTVERSLAGEKLKALAAEISKLQERISVLESPEGGITQDEIDRAKQ